MKHLLLLRHTKAADADGMADRDRPLTERGRRDADLMGSVIAAEPPDLILCSPAQRTRETLAGVLRHLPDHAEPVFIDALYGSGTDYRDTIMHTARESKRVLVIAHNPAVHRTALSLTGAGDAALYAMLGGKFPTAGLAILAFKIDTWARLVRGSGELLALQRPSDFRAADEPD